MLTGKTPFRGDHEAALMYSIVNQDPDPLQKYLPDAPSEFLDVLDRALEKEPDDRYQSVHDMVIDLRKLEKRTSRVSRATPVLPHGDSRVASLREPAQTFQRGKAGPRKVRWVAASVIAIILCVMGWLLFRQEPRRAAFRAGRTSQLTSEPGVEIDPALSPDGKMIAYSSYLKGTLRVHVKQLTGGHTICLTDKMPGYQRFPQWSRDGSEIAFYSVLSNARYLIAKFDLFSVTRDVVPSFGGAPRRIATGVWSCDGKRTAFTWEDTIYTEVIDEGRREKLAVIFDPNLLAWAPDGSKIAFVSGNHYYILSEFLGNIAPSSICVATVPGGVVTQITEKKSLNTSPAWASDGRHLFFVSNCDGTRDIYCAAISRTGQSEGKPERLTTGLNAYTISLSVDSKTLAYSVLTYSGNIWSIRIPEGKPVPLSEATQVTTGNQVIETFGISSDGQWLAYDCNREGNQHIFKVLLKGGEPIQLTRNPSDDFYPNWSPDGRMIAFHSIRAGNRDIFVMLNDGTQLQQITHDTTQKFCPGWSPDGNQIAFYSDRSGRQEIYVVSKISGSSKWGAPRQISFEGGVYPRWSPDGFWIAYGGNGLRVVSPKGGSTRVLVSADDSTKIPHPLFPEWSPDSRTVYYKAVDESQRSSYWAVSLNGGKPRLLVKFDDPSRQPGLGFAVDGKHLFFTINKYESDISKMELIKEE
jgi:Tol biopolymer transport system component